MLVKRCTFYRRGGRLVGSLAIDLGARDVQVRSTEKFNHFLAQAHRLLVEGSAGGGR